MSKTLKYAQSVLYQQSLMQLHGKKIVGVTKSACTTNQSVM